MARPIRTPPPGKAAVVAPAAGDADTAGAGQRERLIAAMISLAADHTYPSISVADIGTKAGVSSATFYELFEDKEDCLLAAYRQVASRVFGRTEAAGDITGWRPASHAALGGLLEAIQQEPDAGRLLLVEALAGGAAVRAERERVFQAFEIRVDDVLRPRPGDTDALDVPPSAVLGAVRSVASHHLRTHREDRLASLTEDLVAWLASYSVSARQPRWSDSPAARLPPGLVRTWIDAAEGALAEPEALPRGRHRLPSALVARTQRTRIIHGTAEMVVAKGFADMTVSDVVAAAGISRDVFYAHFANKQDAYVAAQQFGTQELLEASAAAYFTGRSWPERVWRALQTLVVAIAASPGLSHLRIVECFAAGPAAIEQTEQLKRAATVFLQEGHTVTPSGRAVPRLWSHAIVGAIFETFYKYVSRGELTELPRQLPVLTYIATAPFVGTTAAVAAVQELAGCTSGEG